ncbi:cation diffusion facilitator family transporter [Saccharibacillus sp. CPCC 101409]|uniref:cation diffusion facilitator family transporter n=1 Tax=Saccharibacillus sp. CPCC 101409 TaxID=3058041 RepID=UPI002673C9C5|nr:cation diffusion facilitator family transporter [Saccharibacillus sp. CPCC 101409]MDO3411566.1 cation diffusion facilitator family transporter [Saccharibacillus sp. CPCC 101409]
MGGNAVLAAAKGAAAFFTGSGAMFASAMHSLADAVNQGFVFVGSVLSERRPSRRFPVGFGRVINIFCMIAVIVVTIMAYETIHEGIHLLRHPAEASGGLWINIGVLLLNIIVDGSILIKAMKEILHEARAPKARGFALLPAAFKNVGRAAPPTRLVFYEDIVAVLGALLALIAVVVIALTNFALIDGLVTTLIGCLMIAVAFRVGYDNMIGLIGVSAPQDVEDKVSAAILADADVRDIQSMRIIQEGRYYHVDAVVELRTGLTLGEADDIKDRIQKQLTTDPDIADAAISIIEDDGQSSWQRREAEIEKN